MADGTQAIHPPPAVLIVDDDLGTREIFGWAFREKCGWRVATAPTGSAGLSLARSREFELIILDLRLPDVSGIEVVHALAERLDGLAILLVSAFADVATTVTAMKLGVHRVLEKPLDIPTLLDAAHEAVWAVRQRTPHSADPQVIGAPGSALERWAKHVLDACDAPHDLKTLEQWARFVGVSHTSLCESCRIIGLRPHDCRDFMRVLRAILLSRAHECTFDLLLDTGDRRTLRSLLQRAGIDPALSASEGAVARFFESQSFISPDSPALKTLRALLVGRREDHGK